MKSAKLARQFTVSLLLSGLCLGAQTVYSAAKPAAPKPAAAPAPKPVAPNKPAAQPAPKPQVQPGQTEHELAGRCVERSERSCMSLRRRGEDGKEHTILIIRTGISDETGIYTICTPRDEDPKDTPNIGVFSESQPSGIRVIIDKNVVRVPLAVVTQKPASDDKPGSGGDGRVEASAGQAKFLDQVPEGKTDRLSLCGVEVQAKPAPNTVFVTQGRTELKGQNLVYDEKDGMARIAGPITFQRQDQKDPLSGKSESIEINVDTEATTLVGNVVLESAGGRVSKAARVEYDDQANIARLFGTPGQPAESVKGRDVLRVTKGYMLYNLTTNEVYVTKDKDAKGGLSGEFQDGEDNKPKK